ncbi:MAG TPA: stomatin-like protein [Nitrospirota bacterium]|nr:stomatin-like protein [Nitrospirota bacterium]
MGFIVFGAVCVIFIAMCIKIVPQQKAYVVERLGRYHQTLNAGINIIIPFVDSIAYKHVLKEMVIDVPEQVCITKDNVQVGLDGIVYIQVVDARLASYGISNYLAGITQLAQTTMRSEIGKIMLEKTFEERGAINTSVVTEVDKAAQSWGVKILRYEIKNINPPTNIIASMEKQMVAEREKRAAVLLSEGQRDSAINIATGQKQKVVLEAEAEKAKLQLEAEGRANAIKAVAVATAEGLKNVAASLVLEGGNDAMQLRVAEQLVTQFGALAKTTNTLILPANFGDIGSMLAAAMKVIKSSDGSATMGVVSK